MTFDLKNRDSDLKMCKCRYCNAHAWSVVAYKSELRLNRWTDGNAAWG